MKTTTRANAFWSTCGRRIVIGTMAAGSFLFSSGCASYSHRHPDPVTVNQVLDMSKNGIPAEEIISKIKASGTVYRLKASQLAELQKQGVPATVIDYMQQTYLDAVKRDADYENWRYWTMYDDYWYGGVPFGWPYDTVYVIREPGAFERGERMERSVPQRETLERETHGERESRGRDR